MASEEQVLNKINTENYALLFKQAFPSAKNSLSYINIGKAIEAFEKTLLTPARFDDYLKGDFTALSEKEKKGLKGFIKVGCTTCHSGTGLGGTMYQKIGLVKPYKTNDKGRFTITKKKRDTHKFKVPILRNITKTGPYFHDGSVKTLEKAITLMAEHQVGKSLTKNELSDLMAFMDSLEAKKLDYTSEN